MCAIVGFLQLDTFHNSSIVAEMASTLRHRGPDDLGTWEDADEGLALAHCRLSIIDLSPAGNQPMISHCGRYVLVFNGEIYNHDDLRRQLECERSKIVWRGYSDTETLLAGLSFWGAEACLQKLNGMFAFALWDRKEKKLVIARDRLGEKPLYYGRINNTFLFGSELKALRKHPSWCGEINKEALSLFFQYSYVPTPYSIYEGIYKLPPAHYVVVSDRGINISKPVCYWMLSEFAYKGSSKKNSETAIQIKNLEKLLKDSVSRRMMSDVPLGVFLSGGYDSSIITALMQSQSSQPVNTFSIGFTETSFNEAPYAKKIAAHLGTNHNELIVTPEEAIKVINKLPTIFDEPFADSSQIPTFLVSKLARQHVKVALSGDGGDELFCGYNRYSLGHSTWKRINFLSPNLRSGIVKIIIFFQKNLSAGFLEYLSKLLRINNISDKLLKFSEVLEKNNETDFYKALISNSKSIKENWILNTKPKSNFLTSISTPILPGIRERMMYWDQMTYLPDDILTKVDRTSMSLSLEVRAPFLDHRLVEFAWQLDMNLKCKNGVGKWILRQLLYSYIPRKLMDRPKMGFAVPLEEWLRGPLKNWANSILNEEKIRKDGILDPAPILKMWEEHQSGKRRWHYQLWNVLMFQTWYRSVSN